MNYVMSPVVYIKIMRWLEWSEHFQAPPAIACHCVSMCALHYGDVYVKQDEFRIQSL